MHSFVQGRSGKVLPMKESLTTMNGHGSIKRYTYHHYTRFIVFVNDDRNH